MSAVRTCDVCGEPIEGDSTVDRVELRPVGAVSHQPIGDYHRGECWETVLAAVKSLRALQKTKTASVIPLARR